MVASEKMEIEGNVMAAVFNDMTSWTERLGHAKLRTFTDEYNRFWIEQNSAKQSRRGSWRGRVMPLRGSSTAQVVRTLAGCC